VMLAAGVTSSGQPSISVNIFLIYLHCKLLDPAGSRIWGRVSRKSRAKVQKETTHVFLGTGQQLVLAQLAALGADRGHLLGEFYQLCRCQLRHLLSEAHEKPETRISLILVFLFHQAAASKPQSPQSEGRTAAGVTDSRRRV